MTLLSELRSKEWGDESLYTVLYEIKYSERDVEVDFLNEVDVLLNHNNMTRTNMGRYSRINRLFNNSIDHFQKCEDCG